MNAWAKDVRIEPLKELVVDPWKPTSVTITNDSDRNLAFKLRTTRFDDVKPMVGIGEIRPKDNVRINVRFKTMKGARPFTEHDRLTVLMQVLPKSMTAEQYWKSPNQEKPQRFVITLKPPAEKKKDDVDETESESEEETEPETESE